MLDLQTALKGAAISGGLIMAIGAQNTFVLKQGLLRQHVLWVCLTCALCDAVMITIGVMGLGAILSKSPLLSTALTAGGIAFLLGYALRSFYSAFRSNSAIDANAAQKAPPALAATIAATLAISLLNPHVYLDTVVIIGGIAATLSPTHKLSFLAGAIASSFLWFFSLGYGARLLQPLFRQPKAWRMLEFFVGCLMLWIAWGLVRHLMQ